MAVDLRVKEAHIRSLHDELLSQEEDRYALESKLSDAQAAVEELREQLQPVRIDDDSKAKVTPVPDRSDSHGSQAAFKALNNSALTALETQKDSLQKQLDVANPKISNLTIQLINQAAQLETTREELDEARKDLANKDKQLDEYEERLEKARRQINALNQRDDEVEAYRAEDRETIDDLNRELEEKNEQIDEARKQIDAFQEWGAKAEEQQDEDTELLDTLCHALEQQTQDIGDMHELLQGQHRALGFCETLQDVACGMLEMSREDLQGHTNALIAIQAHQVEAFEREERVTDDVDGHA